jgi:hypothetical protein
MVTVSPTVKLVFGGVGMGHTLVRLRETAHVDIVMVLVSNVTAPTLASNRPSTVAAVVAVIDAKARIFPLKVDPVPSVAELPTCQNMLQDWAPLMRFTLLPDAVVSVEPIWKMKTALGSPWASSVRIPVIPSEDVDL